MVGVTNDYENVDEEFSISGNVSVPAGKYNFSQFVTHLHSLHQKAYNEYLMLFAGGFYDGNLLTIGMEPQLNIGSSLQLSLAYEYNLVKFHGRNQNLQEYSQVQGPVYVYHYLSVSSFVNITTLKII